MKSLSSSFLVMCCLIPQGVFAQNLYYDSALKFSIEFPEGWEVKKSGQPNTIIKAVDRSPGGRITLIAVASYEITPFDIWDLKPGEMVNTLKEEYPTAELHLLESGKTRINGVKAVWGLYTIRPLGRSDPLLSLTYHLFRGSTQFRISATTNGDEFWFKENAQNLAKSIESFRFAN